MCMFKAEAIELDMNKVKSCCVAVLERRPPYVV